MNVIRQVLNVFFPAASFELLVSTTADRRKGEEYVSALHWTMVSLGDKSKREGCNVEQLEWIAAACTKALNEAFPRNRPGQNPWQGEANDTNCINMGLRLNLCWKCSECKAC